MIDSVRLSKRSTGRCRHKESKVLDNRIRLTTIFYDSRILLFRSKQRPTTTKKKTRKKVCAASCLATIDSNSAWRNKTSTRATNSNNFSMRPFTIRRLRLCCVGWHFVVSLFCIAPLFPLIRRRRRRRRPPQSRLRSPLHKLLNFIHLWVSTADADYFFFLFFLFFSAIESFKWVRRIDYVYIITFRAHSFDEDGFESTKALWRRTEHVFSSSSLQCPQSHHIAHGVHARAPL